MSFKTVSVYELAGLRLDPDDTYAVIFGLYSGTDMDTFEKRKDINILYKRSAVNGSHLHSGDTRLRQTMFIFEMK